MSDRQKGNKWVQSLHRISEILSKTPKVLKQFLPVKEIQCAEDIVNALTEVELALHRVTDTKVISE